MASTEHEPIMGSGAEPPVGSGVRAAGQEVRWQSPPPLKLKLKAFSLSEV